MAMTAPKLNLGSSAMRNGTTPETMTLWVLVALELFALVGLRRWFRSNHGG